LSKEILNSHSIQKQILIIPKSNVSNNSNKVSLSTGDLMIPRVPKTKYKIEMMCLPVSCRTKQNQNYQILIHPIQTSLLALNCHIKIWMSLNWHFSHSVNGNWLWWRIVGENFTLVGNAGWKEFHKFIFDPALTSDNHLLNLYFM